MIVDHEREERKRENRKSLRNTRVGVVFVEQHNNITRILIITPL